MMQVIFERSHPKPLQKMSTNGRVNLDPTQLWHFSWDDTKLNLIAVSLLPNWDHLGRIWLGRAIPLKLPRGGSDKKKEKKYIKKARQNIVHWCQPQRFAIWHISKPTLLLSKVSTFARSARSPSSVSHHLVSSELWVSLSSNSRTRLSEGGVLSFGISLDVREE